MVRMLGLPHELGVLEVGCGRGIGLRRFRETLRPRRLVGLDLDPQLLAAARDTVLPPGDPTGLVLGDVRDLPFPPATFDLVVDFGTCYHIAEPGRALAEVARVLMPGGLFVHETRLAQLLSHPIRSFGRTMPHRDAPALQLRRWGGLWSLRVRRDDVPA